MEINQIVAAFLTHVRVSGLCVHRTISIRSVRVRCCTLSDRWKLSDGNSDTSTRQRLSPNSAFGVSTSVDCTTKSDQLAGIGSKTREIWSLIADQTTKDFDHYSECLELVSRGLVSSKVQDMVDHLRHLMAEPGVENGDVDTSCQQPSIMSANGK